MSTVQNSEVSVEFETFHTNTCDSVVKTTTTLLDPSYPQLLDYMNGKWKWKKTCGGIGGGCQYSDSLDFEINMEIYDNEIENIIPYSIFKNDSFMACSHFYINADLTLRDSLFFGLSNLNQINISEMNLSSFLASDGVTTFWQRTLFSTNIVVNDTTCDSTDVSTTVEFLTNINGCDSAKKTTNIFYKNCTELTRIRKIDEELDLIIGPNPTSHFVNIITDKNILSIDIYNVNYKLVHIDSEYKNNNIIDITSLSNGIYFIKITTESQTYQEIFLKE